MILRSYETEKLKSPVLEKKILLLYGENVGLKKEIKESIVSHLKKSDNKLEEVTFFENEVINNDENFYNLIFSGSLFSSKKIISIYSASEKILTTIKNIEDKFPEDAFLVLFSGILEKKSKLRNFFEKNTKVACVPCYPDTEKNLELIAIQKLKKNDILLSKESLNLIIRKVNGDRINLTNELNKIKSFVNDKKKIGYEEIKNLVNSSGEIKSDNLINACLSGEVYELKRILSDISIETQNQVLLLRMLSNKVRKLISIKRQMKKNQNLDNIINNLKPPIFWKEKPIVKKQLSVWNSTELVSAIGEISQIEISCKKNSQISAIILFNFLNKLCKKASF